jgi:hypothetical protein
VFKCGAGEGWRRLFEPIMCRVKYYSQGGEEYPTNNKKKEG